MFLSLRPSTESSYWKPVLTTFPPVLSATAAAQADSGISSSIASHLPPSPYDQNVPETFAYYDEVELEEESSSGADSSGTTEIKICFSPSLSGQHMNAYTIILIISRICPKCSVRKNTFHDNFKKLKSFCGKAYIYFFTILSAKNPHVRENFTNTNIISLAHNYK